jgi:hypothetical protein
MMPITRHKLSYRAWQPSLDAAEMTLREMLESMPAAPPTAMPFLIRLLENPTPPIRLGGLFPLPGAINLSRHDAIHVLLARGLMPQDEAFVIGFTMGSDPKIGRRHLAVFRFAALHLYPHIYQLTLQDLIAFDLGVDAGRQNGQRDLRMYPFEDHLDETVGDLREQFGLTNAFLRSYIAMEKLYLADTAVSHRLDDLVDTDTSHLFKPEGEDTGPLER